MSLTCSIIGHRFGDPVVDRTRDESGSEVVITIRETQTCERCGLERIVSENKEVTTLETPEESAREESTDPEPAGDPRPAPAEDEGAAILEEAEDRLVEEAEPSSEPAEPAEAPDDGGIILEDDTDEPERAPGEWPEEPGEEEPGWQPPTEPADDPGPSPSVEPTGEAVTVPEGTFRCPSCGFTTPVESSSLREGDFCPECHTGSLAHETE